MTDAQDEITALTDSLADVWAELGSWKARALAAEEQVEQAREIIAAYFPEYTAGARERAKAFLARPVACSSGESENPMTRETSE